MIRLPLATDSPAFSAREAQATTLKKETCSSHSLVWRFCQRRLTAMPRRRLAWPDGVYRSSGSRVTLPTRVMGLSGMVRSSLGVGAGSGGHGLAGGARPRGPPLHVLGDPAALGLHKPHGEA